jgi:N4-gp56 family major capsid protein
MAQLMATLPSAVQTQYDRNLLKRSLPELIHAIPCQKKTFKARQGQIIKFRRYNSFAVGSLLSEGTAPGLTAVTYSEVTAQLVQYGALCGISDMVAYTHVDPIVQEISDILGEQMGLTADTVLRNVIVAGTSVYYANGVTTRAGIVTKVSTGDFDKIHRAMRRNKAKYFKAAIIAAGTGVGTSSVREAYIAIVHPDTVYDLEGLTGYKSHADYPSQSLIHPSEVGAYKNFRFLCTTNASIVIDAGGTAVTNGLKFTTANTACDVYQTLIFGQDAVGTMELGEGTQKLIIHKPGSGTDYLEQQTILGWKWTGANVITNDDNMYRYSHGVSA